MELKEELGKSKEMESYKDVFHNTIQKKCEYDGCAQVETQSHCIVRPQWEIIRQGLDLTNVDDLLPSFKNCY